MSEAATRALRTVVQTAVTLTVVLPAIVEAAGIPATLPRGEPATGRGVEPSGRSA